jgi:Fe-S cluster biosynthesis and repair protein YggX
VNEQYPGVATETGGLTTESMAELNDAINSGPSGTSLFRQQAREALTAWEEAQAMSVDDNDLDAAEGMAEFIREWLGAEPEAE